MSNEFSEHYAPNDNHSPAASARLQPTFNESRTIQPTIQSQLKKANADLICKGLLSDMRLVGGTDHSPSSGPFIRGHISNIPEITQGLGSSGDVRAYETGIARSLQNVAAEVKDYMAIPYAVNNSIERLGPILDTAVNYYGNNSPESVLKDVREYIDTLRANVYQNLAFPLEAKQRGSLAGALMPVFMLDGSNDATRVFAKSCVLNF